MYSTRSATPQTSSYRLPGSSSSSSTTTTTSSGNVAQKLSSSSRPATASGVTATRRTPTPTVSQNKLQPASTTSRIIIEEKYHKKTEKGERQVHHRKYSQERFLGKGGFAQCYLFRQVGTNVFLAAKIIDKKTLEKENVKQKLFSEIKIHSSLSNRHIVNFVRYFEDPNNVYILLEVCNCGSMMDLLKSRTRLTEQEARFFLHQLLLACLYMNEKKVIHRDLKLGNLFLTDKMEIKIGDFGLATEVEFDGERKKTICGTPNYIAPEILYNKGHSYEVDIWSIGVILYTMLVGTPPFETKDVKETYKKIKHNDYSFPPDLEISSKAKNLVRSILRRNPDDRPDIKSILNDPFFAGHAVDVCPVTLLDYARTHALKIPDIEETIPGYSLKHPELAQQMVKLKQQDRVPFRQIDNTLHQRAQSATATMETAGLKKPLMTGFPTTTTTSMRPPLATVNTNNNNNGINNENYNPNSHQQVITKQHQQQQPLFTPSHPPQQHQQQPTEQPQKPVQQPPTIQTRYTSTTIPPNIATTTTTAAAISTGTTRSTTNSPSSSSQQQVTANSNTVTTSPSLGSQRSSVQTTQTTSRLPTPKRRSPSEDERKSNKPQTPTSESSSSLETSRSKGPPVKKVRNTVSSPYSPYDILDPMNCDEDDTNDNVTPDLPAIWITHWADFSAKYGLTYLMSNGCVGAVYNDSSKMTYMPATEQINYYERKANGDNIYEERSTFTVSNFPPQMNKKVTLIKYFADVLNKLKRSDMAPSSTSSNSDTGRCSYKPKDDVFIQKTGLDDVFVKRWLRTSHAVIFRLSNKAVQVCFHDQTEIILTGENNNVAFTDAQGVRTGYALNKVVKSPSQEIARRLKYTKEVLCQLISGSATTDRHRNQ